MQSAVIGMDGLPDGDSVASKFPSMIGAFFIPVFAILIVDYYIIKR